MKLTTNRCLQGICHCEISIKPQMIFIFKTEYTESVLYPQMNLFPFILFSVKEWFLCLMSVFIEYAVRYYASKILNISHTKMSKFLMKNSTFHLFYSLKRDFCESQNILPFIRTWKEFSLLFVCVCVWCVSVFVFHCCDKILQKINLQEENFYFTPLSDSSVHGHLRLLSWVCI